MYFFFYIDGTSNKIKYEGRRSDLLPKERPYQRIYEVNELRIRIAQGIYNFVTNNYISETSIKFSVIGTSGAPLSNQLPWDLTKSTKSILKNLFIFCGADGCLSPGSASKKIKALPIWILDSLSGKITIKLKRVDGSIYVI